MYILKSAVFMKYLPFHMNDEKVLWIMSEMSIFKGFTNIYGER